ncbi:hypothetical protein F3Y30_23090 (plasmid) [Sinorhizobium sp. BG8]|nr:hypothetical protein F3Y30_23090 [Sinorhizobium sp. BG8]
MAKQITSTRLKTKTPDRRSAVPPRRRNVAEPQVSAADRVDLPLKKEPVDEVIVPASVNGTDLSTGRP